MRSVLLYVALVRALPGTRKTWRLDHQRPTQLRRSVRRRPARGLIGDASTSRRARMRARSPSLLVVVALLAFLPGFFSIPPIDRDEARFAQATKQMVETRRLRRHPLPGRGALQEAGRHLLAAGGRREDRASALGVPRRAHHASGSIAFLR